MAMQQQVAYPSRLSDDDSALVATLADRGAALTITDTAGYAAGGVLLREIKAAAKTLDERRKSITAPLDAAKRAVMDLFREPTDRLDAAEVAVKRGLAEYDAEQQRQAQARAAAERDRIRKEEEERQRKAAEAQAAREEEERLVQRRREREAERLRDEAERAAAEAPGSFGVDLAAFAAQEAADAAEAARKAAEVRAREEAYQETLRREAAEKAAARVQVVAPVRLAGVSYRELWRCEVIDAGAVPREYLTPDMTKIGAVVRATKGSLQIPGVRIWSETSTAAQAAERR